MTNKQFQRLLDRLHNAHVRYSDLLGEAESEYKRRYGVPPGECDNDIWIDSFHIAATPMTVTNVHKSATEYAVQGLTDD